MKGPKPHKLVHVPGAPRNLMMRVSVDEETGSEAEPAYVCRPPEWLTDAAREVFAAYAAEINKAGYWSPLFVDSLALYASLASEYRTNPAKCSAARVTQMRLLLSELGLTPQSARGVVR